MNLNLDQIVAGCKKGKRKFQAELYHAFAERLYNAALRYGVDSELLHDHVHDAFIKIFTNIKSYKGQEFQIYKWMLRIVINEVLQTKRKAKKVVYVHEYEETVAEDFVEQIINKMTYEEIRQLVKKMEAGDQLIINLSIVDDLSHSEIADLLSISIQNSRTRLSRAKSNLRALISKQEAIDNEVN